MFEKNIEYSIKHLMNYHIDQNDESINNCIKNRTKWFIEWSVAEVFTVE